MLYTNNDDGSLSESNINEKLMKFLDKNFHTYKRNGLFLTKKGEVFKDFWVELYSSGCTGSNIRDAVTGTYYSYKVGSIDEYRFFSVVDSTGAKSKSAVVFFYSSPRQYEEYNKTKLNENIHTKWNKMQRQFDI